MGVSADKQLYMFGGQEDDNRKLCDIWSFDCEAKKWTSHNVDDEAYCPTQRSGHSTCVWNNKMYIFGGILELTHEMNDLVCFDFEAKKFSCGSETAEDLNATNKQYNADEGSPTLKNNTSLRRGKTTMMNSTPSKSPSKKHATMKSTSGGDEKTESNKEGLSSPTSVSMKNSFIIKNADESFETNSKLIPKHKGARVTQQIAAVKVTSFEEDSKPTPRDGHSACVDSTGVMYIFGGDRHHMPFNDLYMIKLE